MKWISVNDELPEKEGPHCSFSLDVLVSSPTLHVDIASYSIKTGWFYRGQRWPDVTHWMPLPERAQ